MMQAAIEQNNNNNANEIKDLYMTMVRKHGVWYTRDILSRYTNIDVIALEAEVWSDNNESKATRSDNL